MTAKKGSYLGTFLTTLFTSLLAPVLVNVVSGALHPADNGSSQTRPIVAAPTSARQLPGKARLADTPREESRRSSGQRDDWNHPWASAAPLGSGG